MLQATNPEATKTSLARPGDALQRPVIGAHLVNPDFLILARSFGIEATRVCEPQGLQRELEVALTRGAPCLIEVQLEPGSENDPKRPCRLVRSTVAWRLSDAIATAKSFAAHSRYGETVLCG